MITDTMNVTTDADWIIGNIRQRSYYRVNYDNQTWNNLMEQLNTNHTMIHIKNRAQIIDDSFNLGRSENICTTRLKLEKY